MIEELKRLYEDALTDKAWANSLLMHMHQMGYAATDVAQALEVAKDILNKASLKENARLQNTTILKRGIRNLRNAMLSMEARSRAGKSIKADLLTAWRERLERWKNDLAQLETV